MSRTIVFVQRVVITVFKYSKLLLCKPDDKTDTLDVMVDSGKLTPCYEPEHIDNTLSIIS